MTIKRTVTVRLEDLLTENEMGAVMDRLAKRIGHPYLIDIEVEPCGITSDGEILLNVTGEEDDEG